MEGNICLDTSIALLINKCFVSEIVSCIIIFSKNIHSVKQNVQVIIYEKNNENLY